MATVRASYRKALIWLAINDDCYWLADGVNAPLSVSASMVADLFGIEDAKVKADLRRTLAAERPNHPALA